MKISTTETVNGEGGGLDEAGTYHVVVTNVIEGESKKGKPIDGITVTFEVMDGTAKGKTGKTHTESFFLPTSQDKKPEMKLRKLTALAIAGNVLRPEDLGTEADIPFNSMVGMQMVVKFDHQMEMDGDGKYTIPSQYLQVAYSDLFHVDDPAVKSVPKNNDALSLITKQLRHDDAWFAFKKVKQSHRQAVAQGNATRREPVMSGSAADDLFN